MNPYDPNINLTKIEEKYIVDEVSAEEHYTRKAILRM
jgi:hypothetical protein